MRLSTKYRMGGAALAAAAGLVMLRFFDPATAGFFPPCPVHYLTGLYCPGCGSLRAMHALLQGNLMQAWAMNPLTVLLLPFLIYGLISEVVVRLRGKGLPQPAFSAGQIRVFCLLVVVFGVVRNIPLRPFALLAPGAMLHL